MKTADVRRRPALILVCATAAVAVVAPSSASAADPQISLGAAADFAVLAGSTITNTGLSVITGDVGVSPGSAITGVPPGQVNGVVHAADPTAGQAKTDLLAAYEVAAAATVTDTVAAELGATTLTPGVYDSVDGAFGISGTVTLDARGDPAAQFVFQATSTLDTAAGSTVRLINGALAAHVFWQVGTSATLGSGATLRGSVLALHSISLITGATVEGRVLSQQGAVVLDTATITRPVVPIATTTVVTTSANPITPGQSVTYTATVTAAGGANVPRGPVVFAGWGLRLGVVESGDGTAVFTTAALATGLHSIRAYYLGASGFLASTSPPVYQLVWTDCSAARTSSFCEHRSSFM